MSVANKKAMPSLDTVPHLSPDDDACLEEIRQVLLRRGQEGKFGVTLLHEHFSVAENEILFEENDPVARTLTIQPKKAADLADVEYRPTSWRLDTGRVEMHCACPTY